VQIEVVRLRVRLLRLNSRRCYKTRTTESRSRRSAGRRDLIRSIHIVGRTTDLYDAKEIGLLARNAVYSKKCMTADELGNMMQFEI